MKKIIIGFFCLTAFISAQAQMTEPHPTQTFGGKLYVFAQYLASDSGLLVPVRDTNFKPWGPTIVFKSSDKTIYVWDGSLWKSIAGGGGGIGDMQKSVYDPTSKNTDVFNYNNLYNKPVLFSGAYIDLTGKPTLFSGSYLDLTNKPTIPTNNNQLTNGAGYLTSVPAQTWTSITGKPSFSTVATTGSYNDLSSKPTIPTNNNQLINGSAYLNEDSLASHTLSVKLPLQVIGDTAIGLDTARHTAGIVTHHWLDSLLALKYNKPTGSISQYLDGTGAPKAFPTAKFLGNSDMFQTAGTRNYNLANGTLNFIDTTYGGYNVISYFSKYQSAIGAVEGTTSYASLRAVTNDGTYASMSTLTSIGTTSVTVDSSGVTARGPTTTNMKVTTDGNVFFPVQAASTGDTAAVGIDDQGKLIHIQSSAVTPTPLQDVPINTVTGTTHTLALADKYRINTYTSSSAVTITIPTNASVAFSIGSRIVIRREGTGSITLSPSSGVTVQSIGGKLAIADQYGYIELDKIATNTWALFGDL